MNEMHANQPAAAQETRRVKPMDSTVDVRKPASAEQKKAPTEEAYQQDLKTFFTHPNASNILGRGGEHVVYEIQSPEFENNVYKINTMMSREAIRELLKGLDKPDGERETDFGRSVLNRWKADWKAEQGERKEFLDDLRSRFGEDVVPKQQFLQQMMPRDFFDPKELFKDEPEMQELIDKLDEQEKMPFRFPAWTTVQRRLEKPQAKIDLNNYYLEREICSLDPRIEADKQKLDLMEKGDDIVWNGDANGEPLPKDKRTEAVLSVCPDYKELADTLADLEARSATDEAAKEELAQLRGELTNAVREIAAFSAKHDTLLDLAGEGNLQIVKNNGKWGVRMPDVLPPQRWKLSEYNRQMAEVSRTGETYLSNEMLNGMAMARAVNGLAALNGIPDRMRIPGVDKVNVKKLHAFTRQQHEPMFGKTQVDELGSTQTLVDDVGMMNTMEVGKTLDEAHESTVDVRKVAAESKKAAEPTNDDRGTVNLKKR